MGMEMGRARERGRERKSHYSESGMLQLTSLSAKVVRSAKRASERERVESGGADVRVWIWEGTMMARGDASETLVPHLRHRFLHEPKGVVCGNGNADCRGVL